MAIRFRFRAIPFVATVLLVALGVSLGQWQDRRAEEKLARQAKLAAGSAAAPLVVGPALLQAADVDSRTVTVTGQFVTGYPLFLDNRPLNRKAGFYLVLPLKIEGSDTHVLVARGWLPRQEQGQSSFSFTNPMLPVTVTGVAKPHLPRVMKMGEPPAIRPSAFLQNLEWQDFAKATGLKVQPFFIEQTQPAAPGDNMVRDWPAPDLGVDKHHAYAFQWYALAVMALLFFVITGFKREPN